jgi:hypothetical protein
MAAELLLAKKTAHARSSEPSKETEAVHSAQSSPSKVLLVKVYFIGMMNEGQGWGLADQLF